MRTAALVIGVSLVGIVAPGIAHGSRYTLVQQYFAPKKLENFYFGSSVAISGDRVAVGSAIVTGQEPGDAGALFIYDRATATLVATAFSPSPQEDAYLGSALGAIGGDFWTNDALVTRIFDGVTGLLAGSLPYPPSPVVVSQPFASAGGFAIIGEPGYYYTVGEWNSGAVQVLDAATGAPVRLIENPDHGPGNQFGQTIAASDTYLVVGAPFDDPGGVNAAGSVYVYDLATGTLLHTLTSPDPAADDGFGWGVAVVGDRIVVGEPGDDTLDNGAGAAHLFDATTGAHLTTMYSTHPVLHGFFGDVMIPDGDRFLIAAPGRYGSAPGTNPSDPVPNIWQFGSVEVVDAATGAQLETIAPSTGVGIRFGSSLAVENGQVAIGGDSQLVDTVFEPTVNLYDSCGNGIVLGGEQCDDGNTTGGDGCSAQCQFEVCPPAPAAGCRTSPKATLVFRHGADASRDQLKWRWTGGGNTVSDLGDPLTSTSYVLCIYTFGAGPQPSLALATPAGGTCGPKPCWRAANGGFDYADPGRTPNGIASAKLRVSPAGRGRFGIAAKGERIDLGALAGGVNAAQLFSTDGTTCWQ